MGKFVYCYCHACLPSNSYYGGPPITVPYRARVWIRVIAVPTGRRLKGSGTRPLTGRPLSSSPTFIARPNLIYKAESAGLGCSRWEALQISRVGQGHNR